MVLIQKHWRLIIFIIMSLALILMYEYAAQKHKALKEELNYQEAKSVEDSIKIRQIIRAKDLEAFRYRDSLRTAKINYILLKNEKSRKQTGATIQRIKSNPSTEFRDSLWTDEWSRKDSLPY